MWFQLKLRFKAIQNVIWHYDERERDCKKSAIFGWWFTNILQETGLIQELKNQKSWKLNQTSSYSQQAENNCTEWSCSDLRATISGFGLFCWFLFKRRSTKNSCAQRRKWGKLWFSQHLCFPLWGSFCPGFIRRIVSTHTHYFHSPDESCGALGAESPAPDRDRSAVLLCCVPLQDLSPSLTTEFPCQGTCLLPAKEAAAQSCHRTTCRASRASPGTAALGTQ